MKNQIRSIFLGRNALVLFAVAIIAAPSAEAQVETLIIRDGTKGQPPGEIAPNPLNGFYEIH
ncbi:MAG: hypothetical protein JRE71_02430, partial [Deltaproteobacteria bacterium]|nr:hypothetical protein [Deltaproteobacteria bacterium]